MSEETTGPTLEEMLESFQVHLAHDIHDCGVAFQNLSERHKKQVANASITDPAETARACLGNLDQAIPMQAQIMLSKLGLTMISMVGISIELGKSEIVIKINQE